MKCQALDQGPPVTGGLCWKCWFAIPTTDLTVTYDSTGMGPIENVVRRLLTYDDAPPMGDPKALARLGKWFDAAWRKAEKGVVMP